MKLPEYDNRPGPNTPLYGNPHDEDVDWSAHKLLFSFIVIAASLAAIAYGILTGFRDLLAIVL